MSHRPRLTRSIPFWALITGSLASIGVGIWQLTDKLGIMTEALTLGTATGLEVYVGQSIAVVAAVLVGVGLIGLALALSLAVAARVFAPAAPVDTLEPVGAADEIEPAADLDDVDVATPSDELEVDELDADQAEVDEALVATPAR